MLISAGVFCRIPRCLLFVLASPLPYDDACLVTFEEGSRIPHAVVASDGRVYDAFALHNFLSQAKQSRRHIIPNRPIEHIVCIPWMFFLARTMWMRARMRLQMMVHPASPGLSPPKPVTRVDAAVQTDSPGLPTTNTATRVDAAVQTDPIVARTHIFMRVVNNNIARASREQLSNRRECCKRKLGCPLNHPALQKNKKQKLA